MTAKELAKRLDARKSGEGWMARCPAHDDKTPSLAIREGKEGRVLLRCWAGCELRNICDALGIKIKDLFERDLFNDMTEDQFVALCKGEGGFKAKVVGVTRSLANGALANNDPTPIRTGKLDAFSQIAKWRGYSDEFAREMCEKGVIQKVEIDGKPLVAFPVENGAHYRKKDGSWRYTEGAKPTLFVIGEIEEGASVHCFESQWDALAYADASGERSNIVATRGASHVKLLTDKLRGHTGTLYLWPQHDGPGKKWAQDIASQLVGQQIKVVRIPSTMALTGDHGGEKKDTVITVKDLNAWRFQGATSDEVFKAYSDAKDFPVTEPSDVVATTLAPERATAEGGGETISASTQGEVDYKLALRVPTEPARRSGNSLEHEQASVTKDGVICAVADSRLEVAERLDGGGEAEASEAVRPVTSVAESVEPPSSSVLAASANQDGAHGYSVASEQAGQDGAESPSPTPAPLALSFRSLSQEYASGPPPVPSGPPIKSLPSISNAAGGLFGLWVVMGEPGIGKSALVRQIACSASRHYDAILDYDYENGPGVIVSRLAAALGSFWHKATENWYARQSITTLREDIKELGDRKAMVIVDSLQSLPASVEFQAESLSKWMQIFEQLARDGHCVVIISEKNRANYGHGGLAAGKGSGAIEYKAWFGLNLIGQAADDGTSPIECDIFKNRHRPKKGRACWIERNSSGFWFSEWSQHTGGSNGTNE